MQERNDLSVEWARYQCRDSLWRLIRRNCMHLDSYNWNMQSVGESLADVASKFETLRKTKRKAKRFGRAYGNICYVVYVLWFKPNVSYAYSVFTRTTIKIECLHNRFYTEVAKFTNEKNSYRCFHKSPVHTKKYDFL